MHNDDKFDVRVSKIGHAKAVRFFAVRIAITVCALALILWWLP